MRTPFRARRCEALGCERTRPASAQVADPMAADPVVEIGELEDELRTDSPSGSI